MMPIRFEDTIERPRNTLTRNELIVVAILDASNFVIGLTIFVIGIYRLDILVPIYGAFLCLIGAFRVMYRIWKYVYYADGGPSAFGAAFMTTFYVVYTIIWAIKYDRAKDELLWYTALSGTLYPAALIVIAIIIGLATMCMNQDNNELYSISQFNRE